MAKDAEPARAQWNTRIGFILAAMGSAIGFGSIARFPMETANNGGSVFIILYAVIMLLIGIPMMISEFSLGRSAQSNTVGTFKKLENNGRTRWRTAGVFYFALAAFFLSWYAIAAGWVLRYAFASATGAYFDDPTAHFALAQEGGGALFWHFVVMGLVLLGVLGVINKGIERINLVMMPILFAIVAGLAVYALTLPGGGAGYEFYLKPDFGAVSLAVVIAAVSQAFFSLSLAEGAMMTYASYLPKSVSLARSAMTIAGSTLVFAFVCGLMIFPMLSAFNLLDSGAAGLDLIFGPLLSAFAAMGSPVGNIVGTLFFAGTFFAAFTSSVSLTEPAISYVTDEHKVPRKKAALLVCTLIYIGGIAVAFSTPLLDLEGGAITNAAILFGGLLLALYVGWFSPRAKARARMDEGDEGPRLSWYTYRIVRYVMPSVLAALLFFAVAGTPCSLSGGGANVGVFGAVTGGYVDPAEGIMFLGCDGTADPAGFGSLATMPALAIMGAIMAATLLLLFAVDPHRRRARTAAPATA